MAGCGWSWMAGVKLWPVVGGDKIMGGGGGEIMPGLG